MTKYFRILHSSSVPTQVRIGQHPMGKSTRPNSQSRIDYQPTIRFNILNDSFSINSARAAFFYKKSKTKGVCSARYGVSIRRKRHTSGDLSNEKGLPARLRNERGLILNCSHDLCIK